MVTIEALQNGIVSYIDEQIAPGLSDLDAIAVGLVSALYVSSLPGIVQDMAQQPLFKPLRLVDAEGNVDIDKAAAAAKMWLKRRPDGVKLQIGGKALRLTDADVDMLRDYVLEG